MIFTDILPGYYWITFYMLCQPQLLIVGMDGLVLAGSGSEHHFCVLFQADVGMSVLHEVSSFMDSFFWLLLNLLYFSPFLQYIFYYSVLLLLYQIFCTWKLYFFNSRHFVFLLVHVSSQDLFVVVLLVGHLLFWRAGSSRLASPQLQFRPDLHAGLGFNPLFLVPFAIYPQISFCTPASARALKVHLPAAPRRR